MNWKISLDRYLTSGPPDDGFTSFCEIVTDNFTEEFLNENSDWIFDNTDEIDKILNILFNRQTDCKYAALVIQRYRNYTKYKKK